MTGGMVHPAGDDGGVRFAAGPATPSCEANRTWRSKLSHRRPAPRLAPWSIAVLFGSNAVPARRFPAEAAAPPMRSTFLIVLLLGALIGTAEAHSEKPNTVVIHPGDVMYARFERTGTKLRLISATKQDDPQAQVVLHFGTWDKKNLSIGFEIENRFDRELTYQVETRITKINLWRTPPVVPVVEGKVAFEEWPVPLDEVAVFGFVLSK
jgi:hypothetical protein